jgi:hypothetical protein
MDGGATVDANEPGAVAYDCGECEAAFSSAGLLAMHKTLEHVHVPEESVIGLPPIEGGSAAWAFYGRQRP